MFTEILFLTLFIFPCPNALGEKIDRFFVEIIDAIAIASFLPQKEKLPFVRFVIKRLDVFNDALGEVYSTILELYQIPHPKCDGILHQVSLFFKLFANPPLEALTANALNLQILDSAACNLNRRYDSSITIFIIQVLFKRKSPLHFFS